MSYGKKIPCANKPLACAGGCAVWLVRRVVPRGCAGGCAEGLCRRGSSQGFAKGLCRGVVCRFVLFIVCFAAPNRQSADTAGAQL